MLQLGALIAGQSKKNAASRAFARVCKLELVAYSEGYGDAMATGRSDTNRRRFYRSPFLCSIRHLFFCSLSGEISTGRRSIRTRCSQHLIMPTIHLDRRTSGQVGRRANLTKSGLELETRLNNSAMQPPRKTNVHRLRWKISVDFECRVCSGEFSSSSASHVCH